ncbi:MAG: phenylalanine--tRNA ligase subunit alpha [Patescibacteria group bacterium]|nr:phenylalanine--tRNA ligase subunit alpha [Patescibacteria group bacterium]
MKDQLKSIYEEAKIKIERASDSAELERLFIEYLGRKSKLTNLLRNIKNLPVQERGETGNLANRIRQAIESGIRTRRQSLKAPTGHKTLIDRTLPGIMPALGHYHPLTKFIRLVESIFISMGFEVVSGPEIELAKYNFDLLNIPQDHPARDLWDTYYIKAAQGNKSFEQKEQLLLRTQTSPVQIRAMLKRQPPVRLIAPGRVFRHEATDSSHESTFYQCEGLVIDAGVKVTDLIGTLSIFLKRIFGENVKIRVRPEYYPFVEPGLDFDIRCQLCGGQGCSVCSQRGWLEILGSGLVHPVVLKNMGVDSKKFSGFAFGLGLDRLMMLSNGVKDIRLSYLGDLRFLRQF